MDAYEALARSWSDAQHLFARCDEHPWGTVVGDDRFPDLLHPNTALVTTRRPVPFADIVGAFASAAPHAARRSVAVFHVEDQTDLITEMSTAGGSLFFDHAYAAGETPSLDTGRVEEVQAFDEAFWRGHRVTTELFGITEPREIEQLEQMERDILIPAGKRWFAVRGAGDEVEAIAALNPGVAAEVDHVATVPAAGGRGHASALVARCVAEARAAGCGTVVLLAQPDGPAEGIYRRLGFARIGTVAGWVDARAPQATNL